MMSNGISLYVVIASVRSAGRAGQKHIFKEHVGFSVEHAEAGHNGRHADRLGDVAFADAGIAE